MRQWLIGGLLFASAAALLALSLLQFAQKGPLLNNAWLWSSPSERERMDKAPHYRQSGVCFLLLAAGLALLGLDVLLAAVWTGLLYPLFFAAAALYAIVSSIRQSRG